MFEVKGKVDVFRRMVETVSVIVSEVKLSANEGELSIKAVDPAHVAMIDLQIKPEAYSKYSASEMEIGIDLDKLNDIIKLARGNDEIEAVYDEDSNRLIVSIGNLVRKMSLLDTTGMPDPKIPTLQFPAKVELISEDLLMGIRAAESVSDYVAFVTESDSFELNAGTQEQMNQRFTKEQLLSIDCKEKVKSLFSLDYMLNMIKAVKAGEKLTLHTGNDYPVRMEFDIFDSKGKVTYLLAPRIENE
jgi:proliferating cell nuclear antigen